MKKTTKFRGQQVHFSLFIAVSLLFAFSCFQIQANEQNCISCHQQQVSNWQKSDHAKAMDIANDINVLGNFNSVTTNHYSQKTYFYRDKEHFLIDLTEQNKTTTYQVKYTFGHYPLQQYLVPASGGKLQVFPFAWDSRTKSEGGQRWYPNYANEDVKPNDRLHWQQPLQNWNGMCADCHSDGLKRNFNAKSNVFNTQWDNINVGCQSCHGKMENHDKQLNGKSTSHLLDNKAQKKQLLSWLMEPGGKVARLKNTNGELASVEEKQQQGKFMNTCFACHSLRTPLTDGFAPNTHLLQQFSPTLLAPPQYHVDGQIKEEVYVYGSFLQSKMYAEGVTCLNCHDAHTMKVKTKTNGLCLQCHNAEVYQQKTHTRHPLDSAAGQCVTCHMPETTYMGVDARRDHSFKIPRPDLSDTYATPNACSSCHSDKSNKWAATQLQQWFGKPEKLSSSEQAYMNLMHNSELPLDQHLALINDDSMPEIKRATAIALLPYSTRVLSEYVVRKWVESPLPLIRLATAQIGQLLPNSDKTKSYQKLMCDEFKAVRVAAANELVGLNMHNSSNFTKALKELLEAAEVTSWRGEGLFNQALIKLTLQRESEAIEKLQQSIEIDPYFAASYINLADIYRRSQQVQQEQSLYNSALKRIPKSAELHYAYGMFLIRSGNKPGSVKHFKLAMQYDDTNYQYPYLYALALDSIGQTAKALAELKQLHPKYGYHSELKNLGLSFSQKLGDRESFQYFSNK